MKARDKFQELNLSNAFLFAAVMNDAEVCRLVLEILTGEPVEAVNVQSEQSILFSSDFRSVRLDVYARDCLEVEYDLEMENGGESLPKRSRYYQSQMDVAALKPGDDVDLLGLSYVIFLCTFDPFDEGLYRYRFENTCTETGNSLGDGTKKIFLNTRGRTKKDVSEELLHFLAYVENTTDECAALYNDRKLDRIHRKVKELKASREWRARYMKFEELLSKEREEGQFAGEKRMLALVRAMLQDNRSDEIQLLEQMKSCGKSCSGNIIYNSIILFFSAARPGSVFSGPGVILPVCSGILCA